MADNSAFSKALHNFTMDAACGDAIRHLTDKGYTFAQIRESLTFPAKEAYIAEVMWKQMVSKGTVLFDNPYGNAGGTGETAGTVLFVSAPSEDRSDPELSRDETKRTVPTVSPVPDVSLSYSSSDVQCGHLVAAMSISDLQYGHTLTVGSSSSFF